MNKNIKRTIALALAVGTISAVAPVTSGNILTTKAYASSDDDNDNEDESLDGLQLESSDGNAIKLYSDDSYDSDSKLDEDDSPDEDTYYAKGSYSKININTDGPSSKYVKVFKSDDDTPSDSTKGKSINDDISVSSGTTYLTIRVYYNEPDSDVRYDDDDDVSSEYTIEYKCTGSDSDTDTDTDTDNADDYDDIYLDKLSVYTGIDTQDISLSESKVDYSCNVAYNIAQVIITATPADEDEDEVTIDDNEVSDNYKKKVSLNVGENKFKIKTENSDDDYREYTLTITRAAQAVTTATSQTSTATTTAVKANQWVQTNGRWQYNDTLGHAVANKWQAYGASWYYLGADSYMQTSSWVTTGGKYYYLNGDGSMAVNTTISGYKVGSDGAWIR